jgi:DNA-binding transcriptional LysR family regulator
MQGLQAGTRPAYHGNHFLKGHGVDHKWLEDFVALARERSFSRAAELRHVTQPQFSRRIRALELWAGGALVNRAGMPLGLTAAGEELLPVARRAVAGLNDVRARIRNAQGGLDWVTLATGRTLSRTAVPGWLARVKRGAGEFRLRILTGSIHDGATALEQGAADFLLSFTHPRLPLLLDEQAFEGITLGTDELVAVSAPRGDGQPQHALPGTARKPVPVLGYAPTLALSQILQDGLSRQPREVHLHTVTESDFAESLHEQALQGTGLAWLPRGLVDGDLRSGRLVEADSQGAAVRFEIRLYRSRSPRSEQIQRIWAASTA